MSLQGHGWNERMGENRLPQLEEVWESYEVIICMKNMFCVLEMFVEFELSIKWQDTFPLKAFECLTSERQKVLKKPSAPSLHSVV